MKSSVIFTRISILATCVLVLLTAGSGCAPKYGCQYNALHTPQEKTNPCSLPDPERLCEKQTFMAPIQ